MKDKGHFYMSLVKSGIRILVSFPLVFVPIWQIQLLGWGLIAAEVFGIWEEVKDKR